LSAFNLELATGNTDLVYNYETQADHTGITALLGELSQAGIRFNDVKTTQSSLEEIFVDLVNRVR
jgi:ABC-2 type transport system ATP-binding protein